MGRGFEKRKKIIMDCLQCNPEIKVADLIKLTGAAVATVRRDLLELEKQKLIVRTFGGIRIVDQKSLVDRTFEQRASCQAVEKFLRKNRKPFLISFPPVIHRESCRKYFKKKPLSLRFQT